MLICAIAVVMMLDGFWRVRKQVAGEKQKMG
jgi:hypothetical protein